MADVSASKVKQDDEGAGPKIVTADGLGRLSETIERTIAYRAYELYEARGRADGHDLEDWFRAERELQPEFQVVVSESYDRLVVRAQLPGFSAREITVGVEPRRVIIWVNRERSASRQAHPAGFDKALRTVDLIREVDPARAVAALKGGTLGIALPVVSKTESRALAR